MRKLVAMTVGAMILSGCMAEAPPADLAAASKGEVKCISASRITGRRITGPASLEFDVGPVTYRNALPAACPGLQNRADFGGLALEVHGSEICAGDSFRAYEPAELDTVGLEAFPRCRLGMFTPVQPTR